MAVKSPFQNSGSRWARYSKYEYKQTSDGTLYLIPDEKLVSSVYDPLANAETMVLDALNVGMLCMRGNPDEELIKSATLDFVAKYGLFGFITALPTTPDFMNYDTVYLPKNRFIINGKNTVTHVSISKYLTGSIMNPVPATIFNPSLIMSSPANPMTNLTACNGRLFVLTGNFI